MPSRISGACTNCRNKKQKCSGDRSGCAQCRATGQECTWPTQKKRGPAKGYIEGLEHRLREAEHLLLQILPAVPNDHLASVTAGLSDPTSDGSPSAPGPSTSTPPPLNKKTGIDYWHQFPLDSLENIRRWQQDCAEGARRASRTESTQSSRERPPEVPVKIDPTAPYDRDAQQLHRHSQSTGDIVPHPQAANLDYTNARQSWSSIYGSSGPGPYAPRPVHQETAIPEWGQTAQSSTSQQFQPTTHPVFPGQDPPISQEEEMTGTENSFYPSESQRQFFW